ncbi:MAG: succinylglutamate desuccinylase/aspartoacylase family protein [Bacteroidota bacterium]
MEERLIGRYEGNKEGPLLIVLAGMHGNEPAGVEALEIIFELLRRERFSNPFFEYAGNFIGLKGNLQALKDGKRFVEYDFNRLWINSNVDEVLAKDDEDLKAEWLELKQLHLTVQEIIAKYPADKIILLDLHTTTADGGIFSVATDDPESVRIAVELHAPVIVGMLDGMKGTTLHYFNPDNLEKPIIGIAFESGMHTDRLSVNRAIAAVINCMKIIGSVDPSVVENRYDELLVAYSKDLPKVSRLLYCHNIKPGDQFEMIPGYKNFQKVKKGQLLAHAKGEPVYAEKDGMLLMPLYQTQGDDGFFLIEEVE